MSTVDVAETVTEEAVMTNNRRRRRPLLVRIIIGCIPRPKSADGWTNMLVWFAALAIPAWYMVSYMFGAHNPSHPFMWAMPWIIAYPFWFAAQMLFLVVSSQRSSEEIRYWEVFKAWMAPTSMLITVAVFSMLAIEGKYHYGEFQWNTTAAFFSATFLNAAIGGAVRFALKGRLFGQLGSGDHHDN
jgi:hypothetical protein